jgi:hypothetical protein
MSGPPVSGRRCAVVSSKEAGVEAVKRVARLMHQFGFEHAPKASWRGRETAFLNRCASFRALAEQAVLSEQSQKSRARMTHQTRTTPAWTGDEPRMKRI